MRKKKVHLLVFAGRDLRQRFKFICDAADRNESIIQSHIIVTRNVIFTFYALIAYFSKHKPDIIISVGDGFVGFLGLVVSKLFRCPFAMRFGGDPVLSIKQEINRYRQVGNTFMMLRYKMLSYVNAVSYKLTDHFFVVNRYLWDQLLNYPVFRGKLIHVLPQFRDASRDRKKLYQLLENKNEIKFLTVTNLNYIEKYHGVKLLLNYLKQYSIKYHRKVVYTICGSGDYLEQLVKYSNEIFDDDFKISIKGYVEKIDPVYKENDIFLYCSSFDAAPNSVLEALSFGLPVIVNESEIYKEMIFDGKNGVTFLKNDINSFFNKLDNIIVNNNDRKKIMDNGFFFIKKNYSKDIIGDILLKRILKIIEFNAPVNFFQKDGK